MAKIFHTWIWKYILSSIFLSTIVIAIGACNRLSNDNKMSTWLFVRSINNEILNLVDYNDPSNTYLMPFSLSKAYDFDISSSGQYIAIRDPKEIIIYRLPQGEEIVRLDAGLLSLTGFDGPKYDSLVSWNPERDQLAFIRFDESPSTSVWFYDIETMQEILLVGDNTRQNALSWSLDGKEIAFAAFTVCKEKAMKNCPIEQQYWDIVTVTLEDGTIKYLTDFSEKTLPDAGWTSNSLCQLQWDPNGKYISFKSYCPSTGIETMADMFVVSTKGVNKHWRLTNFADIDYANKYLAGWSSDGQYLTVAFESDYLFDDVNDERGFLAFQADAFEEGSVSLSPISFDLILNLDWFPTGEQIVGIMDNQKSFIATIHNGNVMVQRDDLPYLSMNGLWGDTGYITKVENRVVNLSIPDGELDNSSLKLSENQTLMGGVRILER